ncbi:MAG: regulatory protein RecX [Anaerovoracaceae bacterium]|jgi:regulatory protein
MKSHTINSKDCHETALRYLCHRDRTAYEMISHLISKGFSQDVIDEEVEYLKELCYIDDERYCEDYIQYAMRKGRGPVRIRLELKKKGVGEDLIQHTLETHFNSQTEKEAAFNEVKKLLKQSFGLECFKDEMEIIDERTLARIGRRLASLGYHGDVIYNILEKLRR